MLLRIRHQEILRDNRYVVGGRGRMHDRFIPPQGSDLGEEKILIGSDVCVLNVIHSLNMLQKNEIQTNKSPYNEDELISSLSLKLWSM